jgi:pterin-4a-carbinolamine dehydratase
MNQTLNQTWQERARPNRLERRIEFADYQSLRDFLDHAADLSEREGLYPDLGFGKNYLNITIHINDGDQELSQVQHQFARKLDQLLGEKTH